MFLKRSRRKKNGEVYEYWNLVKTVRTSKGPRHEVVAALGKAPGLDNQTRRGWENIMDLLDGVEGRERSYQPELNQECLSDDNKAVSSPQWAQVDVTGISVERVRDFGGVFLALALWRRLGFHSLLNKLIEPGKETVSWEVVACILTIARFCGNKSELEVAQRWYRDNALEDLLGVDWNQVNDSRLYRGLDILDAHKDALCKHLLERYVDWFGVEFEFLFYDVTSTYFEGQAAKNAKAKRGYSRDKRPDCKQVNIGLVVTPEGLAIGYEVFDGNRADVTTVEHIVEEMESKYGQANRVWVMDRGMVSESNLKYLRDRTATYIIGTAKSQLKEYQTQYLDENDWTKVHDGLEVKLVELCDKKTSEHYVMCRSQERVQKESAILESRKLKLLAKLSEIHASLEKRPANVNKTYLRVGRWMGQYTAVSKYYEVEVLTDKNATKAIGLSIVKKEASLSWAEQSHGAYMLRTNWTEADPAVIWKRYIQLTQVEDAFRVSKSDLHLRPVFHQKTERVDAHILVCFLTLAMWRTLEMWMKSKGLGDCARQLLKEVETIKSMDVVLPVKNKSELKLRIVAKPDKPVAELIAHLGLQLPNAPKIFQNVVTKN